MHLNYHGRVQGVGFRYSTRNISRQFCVHGFVRNLTDGTVELVAQGESQELEAFLTAITTKFGNHISSVTRKMIACDPNRSGFTIL